VATQRYALHRRPTCLPADCQGGLSRSDVIKSATKESTLAESRSHTEKIDTHLFNNQHAAFRLRAFRFWMRIEPEGRRYKKRNKGIKFNQPLRKVAPIPRKQIISCPCLLESFLSA